MQPIATDHLLALTDDTGLLQHARYRLPAYIHGYCTDDNARALIAMIRLSALRPLEEAEQRAMRSYAAFVDHAFDETSGIFRNFMSYGREWLEQEGSSDSQARALWALATVHASPAEKWMVDWAGDRLDRIVPALAAPDAPRAAAFQLLALERLLEFRPDWHEARIQAAKLADRLAEWWRAAAREDWPWFEPVLAYDNARLAEAALAGGVLCEREDLARLGLRALEALWDWQWESGVFQPVGTRSFGMVHHPPAQFDQQPLEATAMIDACRRAAALGGGDRWLRRAGHCLAWFHGANAIGTALAEPDSGLCRDGLHPDRVNRNAGAESTLSYLLARVAEAEEGGFA